MPQNNLPLIPGKSMWIGCSGQSMPFVFRALNSLDNTFVSLLVIWDTLLNIVPTDMFVKVILFI